MSGTKIGKSFWAGIAINPSYDLFNNRVAENWRYAKN
jgi:hypothetical protein